MLHTGAYWLLWSLRSLMPKRSTWRVAQFDTLRLRLVKLATRVVALKTRVMLHLPSACPDKAILRLVEPTDGEVLLDGQPIHNIPLSQLRPLRPTDVPAVLAAFHAGTVGMADPAEVTDEASARAYVDGLVQAAETDAVAVVERGTDTLIGLVISAD